MSYNSIATQKMNRINGKRHPSIHPSGDTFDDVMLLVSKYMQDIIMFDAPTLSKMILQSKLIQASEFIFWDPTYVYE